MKKGPVLCFGEIVWDAMPGGIFLGGAPLNVAYHLTRLGNKAFPVSRIGRDFLGEETVRRLKTAGVSTDLIQMDEEHPTGAVIVSLNESGDASYEIRENASWDFISREEDLMESAAEASALVYGTLSTRSQSNVKLLDELVELIPVRICDVNLRKPYDDPSNALEWASKATVIKLNDEELMQIVPEGPQELGKRAGVLAGRTGVKTIVVTRGGSGALVWNEGNVVSKAAPEVEVADTVGAGDAFTACFLHYHLKGSPVEEALTKALLLGAHVASSNGAQPDYHPEQVLQ